MQKVVVERPRLQGPVVSVHRIDENPMTRFLAACRSEDSVTSRKSAMRCFMRWVVTRPGFEAFAWSVDLKQEEELVAMNRLGRELLLQHIQAEDSYQMVDFIEGYVRDEMRGQVLKSKLRVLSEIKSFFAKNRTALPPDPEFRVRGDKPQTRSKIRVEIIRRMVNAFDSLYASVALCKWQGLMDAKHLIWINEHADEVVRQIRAKEFPVEIFIPGRKGYDMDPKGEYYTFWGKDSIDALVHYFENVRPGGWPRRGEPIWLYTNDQTLSKGHPIKTKALAEKWNHQLRRMGLIPPEKGNPRTRYGYGMHNMRDEAKTILHTKALKHGLDWDCVKLWMGHVGQIDPNSYDDFMRDHNYVRNQYLIAEPYLNIISNPNPDLATIENEKMKTMQQRIEALEQTVRRFEKMTDTRVTLAV